MTRRTTPRATRQVVYGLTTPTRLWWSTGFGAAKVSSRGQDSPKLLELPPTPGSPSARPGGPGEYQRAEARQGKGGTMPNLAVKPPAG